MDHRFMRSNCRIGVAFALAVALLGVLASVAGGFAAGESNFGTRWWPKSTEEAAYGGTASILPPTGLSVPKREFLLFRSVAEGLDSSNKAGLMQAGYYTSGNEAELDACGSQTSTAFFFEWKYTTLEGYSCRLVGTPTAGTNYDFLVWWATGEGYYGSIYKVGGPNIGVIGPLALHFSYGVHGVGGEINGDDGNNGAHGSAVYGEAYPWQVFKGPGLSEAATVKNPANTYTASQSLGWTIPNPPTPFTVSH